MAAGHPSLQSMSNSFAKQLLGTSILTVLSNVRLGHASLSIDGWLNRKHALQINIQRTSRGLWPRVTSNGCHCGVTEGLSAEICTPAAAT